MFVCFLPDSFTDSAISGRHNGLGQLGEKQLQPWDAEGGFADGAIDSLDEKPLSKNTSVSGLGFAICICVERI